MKKKWLFGGVLLATTLLAGAWLLKKSSPEIPPQLDTPIVALAAGLAPPDLVLATPNLAQLPTQALKIPLFKQVFTEETVDYYEHHPDKLGLEGAVRRIAFEHELNLQDHFISALMAEPAELAMWKTDDGRPGRWILRIKKNNLASLMTWLAQASLSDVQLSVNGEIGGTPLYQLHYGNDSTLWFASQGQYLLVLSDVERLQGQHAKQWNQLLADLLNGGSNPLLQHYGVQAAASGNTVVANLRYLSFGYQSLFASVKALRLDFSPTGWFSHILLRQKTHWDGMPLWQSAPDGAALCLSAPVDWATFKPVSKKADVPTEWLAQLEPAAGICWYSDASLYSPLLLAHTRAPDQFAKHAPALFDWLIGAQESGLADVAEDARLALRSSSKDGALLLQRAVGADDGLLRSDAKDAVAGVARLKIARYFDVSMAQKGGSIVFSPDRKLVLTAMDVQQKRYAALADRMEGEHQGYVDPSALSQLLQTATLATLPGQESQPLLQHAAVTYLLPHLQAIGEFSPTGLRLVPSADRRQDWHWERLQWAAPK